MRGSRSALLLLLLINLFNYIDRQVLAAVVDPIKETYLSKAGDPTIGPVMEWTQAHLGFKPENALAGLLSMAFMLVYMIGAPIFARLAKQTSPWVIVGIGVILWSLASGLSGLAGTFLGLLVTRCFVGVGEAAYGPVAPTIISDLYPPESRGRMLSWFYMAIPVGSALGFVLGEKVSQSGIGDWGARTFGMAPDSWRWAFYLVVLPGVVLGLWSLFMRRPSPGPRPVPAAGKSNSTLNEYIRLLKIPSYRYCTLGMAAMTFAIGGIGFWMPSYLQNLPNGPKSPVSIFGAILVVAGLTGTLAGGYLGDRLRARFPSSYFLVSGVAMLIGFPIFLAALRTPFPWIWVLLFLTCFCLFFNTGPTNTALANITTPSNRAAGFALNILIIHSLGDVISPVVIGLLSDWFGSMAKAFVLVGITFLLAGILWLLGARHLARDTAAAQAEAGRQ